MKTTVPFTPARSIPDLPPAQKPSGAHDSQIRRVPSNHRRTTVLAGPPISKEKTNLSELLPKAASTGDGKTKEETARRLVPRLSYLVQQGIKLADDIAQEASQASGDLSQRNLLDASARQRDALTKLDGLLTSKDLPDLRTLKWTAREIRPCMPMATQRLLNELIQSRKEQTQETGGSPVASKPQMAPELDSKKPELREVRGSRLAKMDENLREQMAQALERELTPCVPGESVPSGALRRIAGEQIARLRYNAPQSKTGEPPSNRESRQADQARAQCCARALSLSLQLDSLLKAKPGAREAGDSDAPVRAREIVMQAGQAFELASNARETIIGCVSDAQSKAEEWTKPLEQLELAVRNLGGHVALLDKALRSA